MPKQGKRIKDHSKYDRSLKREVARRYLAGDFSYQIAAEEYNLPNRDTAKEFVRWYKRELATEENQLSGSHPEVSPIVDSNIANTSLTNQAKEIQRLKEQLRVAELKAAAWRTLVDNAGAHVGIDLVKKFGPKPSNK
jgi:transposase-like protein